MPRLSFFVLYLEWCILHRRHEEDLNHLLWNCQFALRKEKLWLLMAVYLYTKSKH